MLFNTAVALSADCLSFNRFLGPSGRSKVSKKTKKTKQLHDLYHVEAFFNSVSLKLAVRACEPPFLFRVQTGQSF